MDDRCISWCLGWKGSVFRDRFVLKANAQVRWRVPCEPECPGGSMMGTTCFLATCETALVQGKRDQLKEKGQAKCHHRVHTLRPKLGRDR